MHNFLYFDLFRPLQRGLYARWDSSFNGATQDQKHMAIMDVVMAQANSIAFTRQMLSASWSK